ncbi:MAG: hypothetical protein LBS64_04080 [Spirochaetaceae bacterium]|jgi:hypothetical protein|nr:hypothetical protein [Spirochaetaceae bacterium]
MSFVFRCRALLLAAFIAVPCFSQAAPPVPSVADAAGTPASLPRGYGGITLGMSFQDVQNALGDEPAFGYSAADVSFLREPNRNLIQAAGEGRSIFIRSWFHFTEGALYIITLELNPARTDHYSVFSALCKKYGNPSSLSPEKAVWQNDTVVLSLERPLTLKYVDRAAFQKLLANSAAASSAQEQSHLRFLEGL